MARRARFDFLALSVPEKVEHGEALSANLRANVRTYPNPDVSLDTFDGHLLVLSVAYKASLNNGDKERAELRVAEAVVNDDYRNLILYAERITKGDEAMLLALGIHLVDTKGSHYVPDLEVVQGEHSGSVVVKYHHVDGAKSYIFQTSTDGITWTPAGVYTVCKVTISGLTPDTRYYFRVAVVTPSGTSDYCNPVSKMVE